MKRAACLAAIFALAACSNAANTMPPSSGSPIATARARHHGKGKLVLHVLVPKRHGRKHRRAHYISPATQSMTLAISGPTTVTETVGLTPASTGCSTSLTGTFCSLTIGGLLSGSYTATMTTFDGTNGTGNELSSAQAFGFTIVPGGDNPIGITLSGVPVATIVSPADAKSLGDGYGAFELEGTGAHKFLARTIDADGNIIAGPGAPTFTIGTPSGSLAGVTASPASTTLSAPNKFAVTPPSSFAAGTSQFTVTPTFSGQDTDGCAETGANCSGATVIVSMGLNWAQLSPATSPPARSYASMAYDAATGNVVLFGGMGGTFTPVGDTWTWNGTNWVQVTPVTSPSARYLATMAYDVLHGVVVLFGGYGGSGVLADTWTWDGTNWTQQSPANSPQARSNASMAYDALHGRIVLFGGSIGGNAGDTWTWNGTNWTQQTPANSPGARNSATMAYDAGSGKVVLFGGNSGGMTNDTWTWDGTNWTQQSPATSPSARVYSAFAFDPTFGGVILFGGYLSGQAPYSDTWKWNGTNWVQLSPTAWPPARFAGAMTYDAAANALVLFGGNNSVNNPTGDTWSAP